MGKVRHGCATITHAVRAAIQRSQASSAELSRELGINPKTVAKWRKRQTVEDRKIGPEEPRASVSGEEEEGSLKSCVFDPAHAVFILGQAPHAQNHLPKLMTDPPNPDTEPPLPHGNAPQMAGLGSILR